MDQAAAAVARMPRVRAVLVERQRALGRPGGVVMEGRDIGTVVFPDADVKIYLDASPDERARRRAADPAHGGSAKALAEVATALAARDQSDQTRAASPLTIAPDAVLVDTTGVPIEEVVARVLAIVENAGDWQIVERNCETADPTRLSRADCQSAIVNLQSAIVSVSVPRSPPLTLDPVPTGACRAR